MMNQCSVGSDGEEVKTKEKEKIEAKARETGRSEKGERAFLMCR